MAGAKTTQKRDQEELEEKFVEYFSCYLMKLSNVSPDFAPGGQTKATPNVLQKVGKTIPGALGAFFPGGGRATGKVLEEAIQTGYNIEERRDRKKIFRVLPQKKKDARNIFVDTAVKIFRMFEYQFSNVVADKHDDDGRRAMAKLAEDAAERVINYVIGEYDDIIKKEFYKTQDFIFNAVLLGDSERKGIYKGRTVLIKGCDGKHKKIHTTALFENSGYILRKNGEIIYKELRKESGAEIYGYKQIWPFDEFYKIRDRKGEWKTVANPSVQQEYTLAFDEEEVVKRVQKIVKKLELKEISLKADVEDVVQQVEEVGWKVAAVSENMKGIRENVEEVGEKVEGVGEKLEGVGEKVEGVGEKVEGVGDKVEGVGEKVEGIGNKVEGVGGKVEGVGEKVEEVREKVDGVGQKVGEVGEKVAEVVHEANKNLLQDMTKAFKEALALPKTEDLTLIGTRVIRLTDFDNFEVIGSGVFGAVVKARLKKKDKKYAIKITRENTYREVNCLLRSEHQNIVKFQNAWKESITEDFGELHYQFEDYIGLAIYCIQMELCNGRDLSAWILKPPEQKTKEDAKQICFQISLGVQNLHSKNIIHRDLKPANILLLNPYRKGSTNIVVKIGDLGMSKQTYLESRVSRKSLMTNCGTERYRSPEQEKEGDYDLLTDIFSMGIIFLEILYSTVERNEISIKNARKGLLPNEFSLSFQSEEGELIKAMLAYNPNDRPNAESVSNQLNNLWYTKGENHGDQGHILMKNEDRQNEDPKHLLLKNKNDQDEDSRHLLMKNENRQNEDPEQILMRNENSQKEDPEHLLMGNENLQDEDREHLLIENENRQSEDPELLLMKNENSQKEDPEHLLMGNENLQDEDPGHLSMEFVDRHDDGPEHLLMEFEDCHDDDPENLLLRNENRQNQNINTNLLLEELNLPIAPRQFSDKIVDLYEDFPLLYECDASDFSGDYGLGDNSFMINGDKRDPPIYLKGVGFVGRPSMETEMVTLKIKVDQPDGSFLCNMQTSHTAEAKKLKLVDLDKSVRIIPNKEYMVYIRPTVGGVARWENPKKDIILYNEEDGLNTPIKLKVISSWNFLYSLKFSLSE